jgi:glycosyltransferase involved in cell wall biosynthesis
LRLGVPGGYLFLFMFDYLSTIQRKNPIGLIEAFKRAFAPGEGPQLLLKTINGPLRPLAEEAVLWAAHDRADIHVIDCSLSATERDALMATCDCYVSLHRSEGFGLTMAEAMALGKPVIGTAYSGNLEFMTDDTSMLVPFAPVRVPRGCGPYPPDATWADPDLDEAARAMRTLASDPAAAAALGTRARDHIARHHSVESRVDFVRHRLATLRSSA